METSRNGSPRIFALCKMPWGVEPAEDVVAKNPEPLELREERERLAHGQALVDDVQGGPGRLDK
eukprot:9208688-Alexandrium_andersonii.AAC.1